MTKKLLVLAFLLGCGLDTAFSQGTSLSTTTVDWSNSASTLLKDMNGVALSQGVGSANTDGRLVQLGYFSAGASGNNFAGTWIPITGSGASLNTTIGDSPDLSGAGAGRIGFTTTFHFNSNQVDVFDSTDPGHYLTQSSITITSNGATGQPPAGQVLAIRFYDTTNTSGHYNTVSSNGWNWVAPTEVGGGASVLINMATSPLVWESVSVFGLTGTEFKTVLPIPEPSTYALLGLGALGMMVLRRRIKK